MSYIMHNRRVNCLDFLKRVLKEKQKLSRDDLKREIMVRFNFSSFTAERYVRELVFMGVCKQRGKTLTYVSAEGEGQHDEQREA